MEKQRICDLSFNIRYYIFVRILILNNPLHLKVIWYAVKHREGSFFMATFTNLNKGTLLLQVNVGTLFHYVSD